MNVPKEIKDSIRKSAKHSEIAREHNKLVRDWLDELGLGENDMVIDQLIDSIECGSEPNGFIKFLEEGKFNY